MKSQHTFYSWMKLQSQKMPAENTDRKILAFSDQYFSQQKPAEEKSIFLNWKLSGFLTLATLAVVIVLMNKQPLIQKSSLVMMENDSPEMILNYKDIELMADASDLSEAEWARINSKR
jgi:hypothetical protein